MTTTSTFTETETQISCTSPRAQGHASFPGSFTMLTALKPFAALAKRPMGRRTPSATTPTDEKTEKIQDTTPWWLQEDEELPSQHRRPQPRPSAEEIMRFTTSAARTPEQDTKSATGLSSRRHGWSGLARLSITWFHSWRLLSCCGIFAAS